MSLYIGEWNVERVEQLEEKVNRLEGELRKNDGKLRKISTSDVRGRLRFSDIGCGC